MQCIKDLRAAVQTANPSNQGEKGSNIDNIVKCSVCGGHVRRNPSSGSTVLIVDEREMSPKKCSCWPPTFSDRTTPRPDHWPPVHDPCAYHIPGFVPRREDLIRPGKQKFTYGELKGKTFRDVYDEFENWDFSCRFGDRLNPDTYTAPEEF